jgi:lipopolysaccharide export system permease protein
LNIDLTNLQTSTIKLPKLQETTTLDLTKCVVNSTTNKSLNCIENSKKEIITVLNRRIVLPTYIPLIALLCSFLLIKKRHKKRNFLLNKYSIFVFSFLVLLYAELIIRYTGISKTVGILFIVSPLILIPIIYSYIIFKLSRESVR